MRRRLNSSIIFLAWVLSGMWLSTSIAAPPAIQTQYGPDGIEVDLVRAKISGNVLSVVFSLRNTGTSTAKAEYDIANVHFIDNTESKKYHVLKDEKGEWLCGPIEFVRRHVKGEWVEIPVTKAYLSKGKKKIVWYKFPAPPESVTKIHVNLPDISPFDDVEITR